MRDISDVLSRILRRSCGEQVAPEAMELCTAVTLSMEGSGGSIGALTEPEFVTLVSWSDRLIWRPRIVRGSKNTVEESFRILAVPLNPRISCKGHVSAHGRPLYSDGCRLSSAQIC